MHCASARIPAPTWRPGSKKGSPESCPTLRGFPSASEQVRGDSDLSFAGSLRARRSQHAFSLSSSTPAPRDPFDQSWIQNGAASRVHTAAPPTTLTDRGALVHFPTAPLATGGVAPDWRSRHAPQKWTGARRKDRERVSSKLGSSCPGYL